MPQTKHPPGSLEALAEVISKQVKGVRPRRPQLRLVPSKVAPEQRGFDDVTRDSITRRVQFLARRYGTGFLVEQATFDVAGGIAGLSDEQLSALLNDMERARECITEGICLEDAQLIRRCDAPEVY